MIQAPTYYSRVFDPQAFPKVVAAFVDKVRELAAHDPSIKAIAACGNSGVPVAAAASCLTGLSLIVVRKANEPLTHSGSRVTGYIGEGRYIIVDDLIDSGGTLRNIDESIRACRDGFPGTLEPAIVVLYQAGDYPRDPFIFRPDLRVDIVSIKPAIDGALR
jgi:orotate phosphoribosyltransferase